MPGALKALLAFAAVALALVLPTVSASAATSYPGDPYLVSGDQWYLLPAGAGIGATQAWCSSTGAGVTIAGLTTGADFSHPDLGGQLATGARFTSGDGDPGTPDSTEQQAVSDDEGSGTAIAGLMVALTGNGVGIASVAPSARELVVKDLDNAANGHANDVAAAVTWSLSAGARVIYIDLGPRVRISGDPGLIVRAIDQAARRGVAVVVGGGGAAEASLSAAQLQTLDRDALVVGGIGPDGRAASSTVHFEGVNIWAPGGDSGSGAFQDADHMILSTAPVLPGPDQYQYVEGPDYAGALVAGGMADMLAAGYSASAARLQVLNTTRKAGTVDALNLAAALGVTRACGSPAAAPPTPLNALPKDPAQPLFLNPTPGSDLGLNFTPPPNKAPPPPWLPILIPPLIIVVVGGAALWWWGRR